MTRRERTWIDAMRHRLEAWIRDLREAADRALEPEPVPVPVPVPVRAQRGPAEPR